MKVATFNANTIRSRMPIILDWMKQHKPDILCIQETKVRDNDFPAKVIHATGYGVIFSGEKSYNGVAILSRMSPTDIRYGLDDGNTADPARLIAATYENMHVINTYVPQGRALDHQMYAYKLQWLKRLRRYFERHYNTADRVIWAGDMNVAPTPLDVNHPERHAQHVCYHDDARKAFANCAAWGFTDVFRTFHPEERLYSFYDYRVKNAIEKGLGWRIDAIMATQPLAGTCTNAWIDLEPRKREKPSDHTFLVAEFN
jgi:exodeoxyribonuclease-3